MYDSAGEFADGGPGAARPAARQRVRPAQALREVDGQRLAGDPEPAVRRAEQTCRRRADRGVRPSARAAARNTASPTPAAPNCALDGQPRGRSASSAAPSCCGCSCSVRSRRDRPASTWSPWPSTPMPRSSGSKCSTIPSTGAKTKARSSAVPPRVRAAVVRDGGRLGPLAGQGHRKTVREKSVRELRRVRSYL